MVYRIFADIVVLLHFLWILFLMLGVFFGIRYKIVKIFHISGIIFALVFQIFNWHCPLTYIEIWFRAKQDPTSSYSGSFIIHYIEKLVYIDMSRNLVFMLSILLFICAIWFYLRTGRKKWHESVFFSDLLNSRRILQGLFIMIYRISRPL